MSKFTWDDIVCVAANSRTQLHSPMQAWIVGVFEGEGRRGTYFERFPPGSVYSVEFEDGASAEVHEDDLELWRE